MPLFIVYHYQSVPDSSVFIVNDNEYVSINYFVVILVTAIDISCILSGIPSYKRRKLYCVCVCFATFTKLNIILIVLIAPFGMLGGAANRQTLHTK